MTDSSGNRRTIRSFVRRTGRMTPAQDRALTDLWPKYGVDYSPQMLDLGDVFGRSVDRVLEIGFGNGETLIRDAAGNPELDFLGVEVHEPGIGHCLIDAAETGLGNLRVIRHDAIEVLQHQVPDGAFTRINLYFPDPWPKKRHHKRRIVQDAFLTLVASRLVPGGSLHIATDWQNYAEHIDELIAGSPLFTVAERHVHKGDIELLQRQQTKFERRGICKGHSIWDWRLRRN